MMKGVRRVLACVLMVALVSAFGLRAASISAQAAGMTDSSTLAQIESGNVVAY